MMNRRLTQEKILRRITLSGGLGILPFAIYRLSVQDWVIGVVDLVASSCMLLLYFYVSTTKKIEQGCKILSSVSLLAVVLTIHIKGAQQIFWLYPALVSFYYLLRPKTGMIYASIAIILTLPLIYQQETFIFFVSMLVSLIVTLTLAYIFASQMEQQQHQLIEQATKDPLTGAGNRRALGEKMEQLIASFQRTGNKATLLLLDLDDFKHVNDTFGHNTGDSFLVEVSKLLRTRIRLSDSLFRFGGEEFIVVAESTDLADAKTFAEELRSTIEHASIIPECSVTVSIGIAELNMDEPSEQWIKRADNALFKAKDMGKNTVYIAES